MQPSRISALALCFCALAVFEAHGCLDRIRGLVSDPARELEVEYIGCVVGRALPISIDYASNRVVFCNDHCFKNGFKYMGMQGTKCFCETRVDEGKKVDQTKCSTKCPGEAKEICGGEHAFSAYITAPTYTPNY